MTIAKQFLWKEGKDLWFEYVRLNGYSWSFNNDGIKKLSKFLDLNTKYIKERLNVYLDN